MASQDTHFDGYYLDGSFCVDKVRTEDLITADNGRTYVHIKILPNQRTTTRSSHVLVAGSPKTGYKAIGYLNLKTHK